MQLLSAGGILQIETTSRPTAAAGILCVELVAQ